MIAMAVGAHPDDIEFAMAGTLVILKERGWQIHYMPIANGSCGSVTMSREDTIATRSRESQDAAASIGAAYHPPLVDDIEILYEQPLIRKLCAILRQVSPEILLLPSPQDYMEDHMNASRTMVTAAFCRNMPNYLTDPPTKHIENEMCLYHAMPYGLHDQLRNPVRPDFFVDTSAVIERKQKMLACHVSQKQWLDESQGVGNYLNAMLDMSERVGRMSGRFRHAESWRRHSHLGFGPEGFDPLCEALQDYVVSFERGDL